LANPYVASGVARAAEDWPTKAGQVHQSVSRGGATDVLSRVVCQQLSELSGQQFVVENKGGSGGNVGADAIAKSPPDGYTVGLMSIASHAISPTLYSKLPFDAEKDFTPISMLWQVPNIFVVRPDIPANTVPELVALVKANPGKYTFASGGSGTSPHICGEMLKQRAASTWCTFPIAAARRPCRTCWPARSTWNSTTFPGRCRSTRRASSGVLQVTSLERSPVAPELPPMNDFYPGFQITSWGGLCGPAGLPPAMVEKASALAKKALQSEALKTAFLAQGATPFFRNAAEAAEFRRAEEKHLAPVIIASGAR
jgi:tripartite-type tricarboxylate transporter receptor subunit TctC